MDSAGEWYLGRLKARHNLPGGLVAPPPRAHCQRASGPKEVAQAAWCLNCLPIAPGPQPVWLGLRMPWREATQVAAQELPLFSRGSSCRGVQVSWADSFRRDSRGPHWLEQRDAGLERRTLWAFGSGFDQIRCGWWAAACLEAAVRGAGRCSQRCAKGRLLGQLRLRSGRRLPSFGVT